MKQTRRIGWRWAEWRRAVLVMTFVGLVASLAGHDVAAQPAETGKERLSDKASDDQRVDNCRVPPERRGAKPRPDCGERGAGGKAANDQADPPREDAQGAQAARASRAE